MKHPHLGNGSSPLVLAIDIGTSSLRVALFDGQAKRMVETTAQETYPLRVTLDGGAELDPRTLRQTFLRCLRRTLRSYRTERKLRSHRIMAVATSCFWHGLLGTDEQGRALTPIYTWADSRCHADAARLREEFSERAVHARTGCMLRSSYWPAKLLWLRRTQPKLFGRVVRWMSLAELLHFELCGEAECSYSMASGTGLFNPSTLRWDAEMLRRCRISPQELHLLGDGPLVLSSDVRRHFPELRDALVFPAIGDGAAGNLGSGATSQDLDAVNFGTSGAIRVMRPSGRARLRGSGRFGAARAPFGLFCYRVDAERVLIGGAVSNAGNLRAWCLRELHVPDVPRVLERALASDSGADHGLTVLPFWMSERAPTWPEDLRGVIVGLTQATSALDILLATQEATFQRLAQIAEQLSARRFVVSGGIERSPAELQLLADVLGRHLIVCGEPEASLRGAAVFVLEKVGITTPAPSAERVIKPRMTSSRRYEAARRRQMALEKVMSAFGAT